MGHQHEEQAGGEREQHQMRRGRAWHVEAGAGAGGALCRAKAEGSREMVPHGGGGGCNWENGAAAFVIDGAAS